MAGTKRERELHRQKLDRQQKESAAAAAARGRWLRIGGVVVGVIAIIGVVVAVALAQSDSDATAPTAAPAAAEPTAAAGSCSAPNGKAPGTTQYKVAKGSLAPNSTYGLAMTTNCGTLKLQLDAKAAPKTTLGLTYLADQGFYNNTTCHRLTTQGIFVLQCGDPKGNGTGGPGFTIPDENLPKAAGASAVYRRGSVAMANAGPNTTGSQFFLVYKDSPLPPNYTVVGTIVAGMPILDDVASQGTADGSADGPPKQPVQITKMVSTVTNDTTSGQ